MTDESDFEILGHVVTDHYRAVVDLRVRNAALAAENAALRAALTEATKPADEST